ncbi:MAG TPA: BatD family protein [bacterium]|nr:BatD family protein [bacterium]
MNKKIFILFICLYSYLYALDFISEVNRTKLGLSEQLIYTIKIRAGDEIGNAQLVRPDFKGFRLIQQSGPSTMSSISIINGRMTRSYERTYTFVLIPEEIGEFTIQPAYLIIDNQKYQSQSHRITVIKEAVKIEDFFIKAEISKTECFVDEMLIYTIKLFYRRGIDNLELIKVSDFNNFIKENLIQTNNDREITTTEYNGVKYNVQNILKFALFPVKSGEYIIEEPVVRTIIGDGFFRPLSTNILRANEKFKIIVKSLPEQGQPKDFSGSIGKIKISLEVKNYKKEVKVGESIIALVKLYGEGNVKGIKLPVVRNNDWFNLYEPSITEKKEIVGTKITFEKELKYIVVPSKKGEYQLGPFEYIFFNPETKNYERAISKTFSFNVLPGDRDIIAQQIISTTSGTITTPFESKESIMVKESLKYIKEDKKRLKNYSYLILSKNFIILESSGLIVFILCSIIKIINRIKEKKFVTIKSRKALKTANKILKGAKKNLVKKDYNKFAYEISTALFKYFGDKFNISNLGLTTETIKDLLKEREVPEELINKIINLCANCDLIRFSQSSLPENKYNEIYEEAEKTIVEVEKYIKK